MDIRVKRIYEPPAADDGKRILVDRLWPRGISKASGRIDLWMKEIAPSHELRKWFGHDPEKYLEFKRRYLEELKSRPETVRELLEVARNGRVTFLYSAKDKELNQAIVLKEFLEHQRF